MVIATPGGPWSPCHRRIILAAALAFPAFDLATSAVEPFAAPPPIALAPASLAAAPTAPPRARPPIEPAGPARLSVPEPARFA